MKVRLPQIGMQFCSGQYFHVLLRGHFEMREVTFMLDESAVGLSVEQDFSYTWRDLILYNLSVKSKAGRAGISA